jgi:hypothetical protein
MEMKDLQKNLDKCLAEKRAVYAVVAIMGFTEQCACDPLKEIVELRKEVSEQSTPDAYFTELFAVGSKEGSQFRPPCGRAYYHTTLSLVGDGVPSTTPSGVVPSIPLRPSTPDGLLHLQYYESITVDPHKRGYIQYPAGGLLYHEVFGDMDEPRSF